MKINLNGESPIDYISVDNDFEGFGGYSDGLYSEQISNTLESPVDVINGDLRLDYSILDQIAVSEDYMGLQDYLDTLDDENKIQAREYLESKYPEFFQDAGDTFEPMKDKTPDPDGVHDDVKKRTRKSVATLFVGDDVPYDFKYAA